MKSKTNIVEEPFADYKKAEDVLLRKADQAPTQKGFTQWQG